MIKIVWIVGLCILATYVINRDSSNTVGRQSYFIADSIILRSISEISNYTEGTAREVGGLTVTGDFTKGQGLDSIEKLIDEAKGNHFYFLLGMHFYSGRNKYEGKYQLSTNFLSKMDLMTCNQIYPDIVGELNYLIEKNDTVNFFKKYCFGKTLDSLNIDERLTVLSRLISRLKLKKIDIKYAFLSEYIEKEYLKNRNTFTDINSLYIYSQYAFWLWNSDDLKLKKELLEDWPMLKEVDLINNSISIDELNNNLDSFKNKIEFDEKMFAPAIFKILKDNYLQSNEKEFYHYFYNRLRVFTLINSRRMKNLNLKDLDYKLDNNPVSKDFALEVELNFIIPFYSKIIEKIKNKNSNSKIIIFQYPGFDKFELEKKLSDKDIEIVSIDEWLNLNDRKYFEKFVDNISNSGHFTKELSHEFSQKFINSYLK